MLAAMQTKRTLRQRGAIIFAEIVGGLFVALGAAALLMFSVPLGQKFSQFMASLHIGG